MYFRKKKNDPPRKKGDTRRHSEAPGKNVHKSKRALST